MLMLSAGEKRLYTNRHILMVNGATREGGNTDTILNLFAEGAQAAGSHTDHVLLRNLTIADCIGCCTCLRESKCHFDDDMTVLRQKIIDASVLVFASPLYFCEVTGIMKTFIDRMYFFYHDVNKKLIAGKKVLIITTLGEKERGFETEVLEESYKRLLKALDLRLVDMHFFPDLMEKESISQKPAYLEKAYNIGNSTATVLTSQ
jgi:multimeric flavodoxin WrbA